MNKVNLIGRLTYDTELRYNKDNIPYVRFTLAINRNYTNQNGERDADFISCIAWRKTAELINQYFNKGSEIGVSGRIQTGSFDKEDGTKVYTTDVVADEITFIGKKKDSRPEPEYTGAMPQNNEPINNVSDEIVITDDDLPF